MCLCEHVCVCVYVVHGVCDVCTCGVCVCVCVYAVCGVCDVWVSECECDVWVSV